MSHWFSLNPLLGFIDGSYKRKSNDHTYIGIGGLLRSKEGTTKLIFSGPVLAESSYDAEVQALSCILNHICASHIQLHECMLLSDCSVLVNNVLKLKSGSLWEKNLQFLQLNDALHKVNISYIPRRLNSSADWLAKEGARRNKFIA